MPLKLYDSAEAVPEPLRATAIETKAGKWAVDEPADVPDVAKLMAGIESERATVKAQKKRADDAEKERDELKRTADARAKGISEEELQKIRDAEATARKPLEDKVSTLEAENRKLKLTDRVQAEWLKFGGLAERAEDAMFHLGKRTDLGDEGGIVYRDKDGKITADAAEAFFAKFRTEKPWLFAGTGASGSGADGKPGGDAAPPTAQATKEAADRRRVEIAGAF